ncbi:MAG TPA: hypothetical protein VGJ78_08780 [Vicinamibacterales bacterium]
MRPSQSRADLAAGQAALDEGAWQHAQHAFERALAAEETPEALEALGLAAWWLDLADVVFDSRERAYREYRSRGDLMAAARVAVWIAWDSAAFRGEEGVARGWLHRARRLLEGQPESPEHAFLAARAAVFALLDDGDPEAAETLALEAIRIGQLLGTTDYEMLGRSLLGFALVTTGRVTEGLRELDEVSAAILGGELNDRLLIGLAGCYLIAACDRVRDLGLGQLCGDRHTLDVPPPPGARSPLLWGTKAHLRDLFADAASVVHTVRHFAFRYESPAHFVDVFRRFYGPVHKAFAALDADGQASLEADLIALLRSSDRGGAAGVVVPSEYLETVIIR